MLVVFCCHAIKNKVWHVQVLMHIYISSRSLKKKNAQSSQLDPKLLITLLISFRNTNFYFQYDTKCKP